MPSSSARSTRSGAAANNLPFPTSKRAGSSSISKATTMLFRREVQAMLSTPPASPSHIPANTSVRVVASIERLSGSGMQESVQLCKAGEEEWVTRTEGERSYFPRVGRVQKRVRAAVEDEEDEDDDEEDFEDTPVRPKKKSPSRRSARRHGADHDSEPETPIASSSRKAGPASPKKKQRKSRHHADDDDEEGGAIAGPGPSSSSSALGRGQRRCTGRPSIVKKEHDEVDDLASLCGRVDGLDVRSTVGPETEWERTPVPTATSPNDKGKGRA
ncbi:hypothetical protein JCM5296_007407 [Sporobolomyces johnsonii]